MDIKFNSKYFFAFVIVFVVELLIALFIRDNFIRGHVGDVLVVVLIYCFIKAFVRNEIKLLWLYIFIFATIVEIGQYFHLIDLLGLGENQFARIILGTTFDIWDIVCYFIGCVGILLLETVTRKQAGRYINE